MATDAALLAEANHRATAHYRTLRRVVDLTPYDMTVYEDRETGDRRKLPNKSVVMYGVAVAFELADPISLLQDVETE